MKNAPKAEAPRIVPGDEHVPPGDVTWKLSLCRCGHVAVRHRVVPPLTPSRCYDCTCADFNPKPAPPAPVSEPSQPKSEPDKNRAFQLDRDFHPVQGSMTGRELMGLLGHPDRELWKRGVGAPDRKIAPDDVVEVRVGCRFYSAPRVINNGDHSEQPLNMVQPVSESLIDEALMIAAQCWCDPETERIVMEPALAQAFAKRLSPYLALKAQNATLTAEVERLRDLIVRVGATEDALSAYLDRDEEEPGVEADLAEEEQIALDAVRAESKDIRAARKAGKA